jgi:hypothetical protein
MFRYSVDFQAFQTEICTAVSGPDLLEWRPPRTPQITFSSQRQLARGGDGPWEAWAPVAYWVLRLEPAPMPPPDHYRQQPRLCQSFISACCGRSAQDGIEASGSTADAPPMAYGAAVCE